MNGTTSGTSTLRTRLRLTWILGAALAAASATASGQSAVDPRKGGEITVKLEFENIPTGCRLTSYQPEVRLDGRVVSWRAPSFVYQYDTGNPATSGWALRTSGVVEGSHEIRVALPSGTCGGYGWLPNNRATVTLNSRNSYKATAQFNYTRMVTPPKPENPTTVPTRPLPIP